MAEHSQNTARAADGLMLRPHARTVAHGEMSGEMSRSRSPRVERAPSIAGAGQNVNLPGGKPRCIVVAGTRKEDEGQRGYRRYGESGRESGRDPRNMTIHSYQVLICPDWS